MKTRISILLLIASMTVLGQSVDKIPRKQFFVGVGMRLGFIEPLGVREEALYTTYTPDFSSEKNIQGLSINVGYQHYFSQLGIGLRYFPGFRYDYIKSNFDYTYSGNGFIIPNLPPTKEFIIDHSFHLIRYLKKQETRKLYPHYGFGLTLVNFAKGFEYIDSKYYDISFTTYDLFIAFPVKDVFYVSPYIYLIPEGHPEDPKNSFMSFGIKINKPIVL